MALNLSTLRSKRHNIFYGWFLVPTAGFIHMITSVPMFHAMSLWLVALESAFGWNRTQLTLAFSFTRIEGGFLGPIEGYLADKLGTRRMVFIGLTIMGIGFLLLGQVRSLWMFYLAFLVMALGQGLGGWLPLNAMLNNWFIRNRATAMGWSNSIGRLGGLFLIPAIAWGVDPQADNIGFRATATILGVVAIVLAFPISRIIRNRPEDVGLLPDGDTPESDDIAETQSQVKSTNLRPVTNDLTLRQALRTPAFWFISFGHGFTSMLIIGMMANLGLMLKDQGFSVITSGLVVTTYTATSMVFQVIGGYIGDRVPKNIALFVFTTIQAGSVLILTLGPPNIGTAYAFAIMFGIGFGGRNPLTTSIRGDYFGRRNFGKIMGMSQVPMNVLLLIAPVFAGYMFERQGTYSNAFLTLAALSFFGGVLLLMAKKPQLKPATQQVESAEQIARTTHAD